MSRSTLHRLTTWLSLVFVLGATPPHSHAYPETGTGTGAAAQGSVTLASAESPWPPGSESGDRLANATDCSLCRADQDRQGDRPAPIGIPIGDPTRAAVPPTDVLVATEGGPRLFGARAPPLRAHA